MSTNNPLRIFTPEQIKLLREGEIKSLKKEFLLLFQLSHESAITFNGIEIDKNGVLQIFDQLEAKLPLYLLVREHKSLSNFLNHGALGLFNDKKAIEAIKNQVEYREEIEQMIVEPLQNLLVDLVKPNKKHASTELYKIKRFIQDLNPGLFNIVYLSAYKELKIHLDYLQDRYPNPYRNKATLDFHPELGQHVSFEFYRIFSSLPDSFKALSRQYCTWCNNSIIYEAFHREKRYSKFKRKSLIILRDAAKIARKEVFPEHNRKIVEDIDRILKSGTGTADGCYGGAVAPAIFIIIFIVKLALIIGKHNSGSRSYSSDRINYNDPYKKSIYPPKSVSQRLIENQRKKNPATDREYLLQEQSGNKFTFINAELVDQKNHDSYSELTFNVDVLPAKYAKFYNLLPNSLAKDKEGEIWPVVFNFKHPAIKGSTLTHRADIRFKSNSNYHPLSYFFEKSSSGGDLNLSVKRIPKSHYPLNGVLSRTNPKTGEVLHASKFTIERVYNSEDYVVTLKQPRRTFAFSKTYINELDPARAIDEKDRFAVVIKNINTLNLKYLRQGAIYSMNEFMGYTIDASTQHDFPLKQMESDSTYLKYYITSEQDGVSYVEAKGRKINLKYYVDFSTGITKGMTMVTSSDDLLEIERITLFSSQ